MSDATTRPDERPRPRPPTEPTTLLVRMARDEAEHFRLMSGWEDRHPTDRKSDEFRWMLMHGLADRLESLEATIADLIAAWPEIESDGPILWRVLDGWRLCTTEGAAWPGCDDGPYPTCEAAIMAHVASEREGLPT